MANEYLKRQREKQQKYAEIGMDTGFQKCWDLVQLCLIDSDVMGKDVFGKERIDRLFRALHKYERELGNAWMDEVDSDVMQDKIDAGLRRIHGKDFVNFSERYPEIVKTTYSHSKKRWR